MKAIVIIPERTKYHGLTFAVNELTDYLANLQISEDESEDIGFGFIWIVDFDAQLQIAYDNHNWYGGDFTHKYNVMIQYAEFKKIVYKKPEFNPKD